MGQYLNLPSFCDYIIVNYYAGNLDWDDHNYSALFRPGLGFIFQDWDGEMTLFSGWNSSNPDVNVTSLDTSGGPTQLFVDLLANPDFRQMFADHVYKDLSTALSPTNAAAMYTKEANTISTSVLDESARWGNLGELDGTWGEMGTPATWSAHINEELGSWFPVRTAEMFSQFDVRPPYYTMYPSVAPPALYVNGTQENGGTFSLGASLTMTATTGTIYYTTDGSDPRTSSSGFTVTSIVLSGTTATVTLGDADTGLNNGETIYISGANQSAYDGTFTIANLTASSTAGTTTFNYTVSGSPASPATELISGQPIIAATAVGGAVSATAHVFTGAITLSQGETINARVLSGSTWSALNSSTFYVNLAPYIRITELNYDPLPATQAEKNAGYVPSDTTDPNKDFEFVELQNISSAAVPLGGLAFTNGVTFTFPNVTLAAGAYIVVCADPAAFAIRYGESILEAEYGSTNWATVSAECAFSGHFAMGGEEVTLTAPNGGVIQDFTYSSSWYPQTHGGGFTLVARSATQAISLWNSSLGWEPSGTPGGTPGETDPVTIPLPGAIVINEVLANPTGTPGDMIELYNTTSAAITIGGWFLSDNSSNLSEYQIAAGATILANGYYVLTQDYNFGSSFVLDPDGSTVYLSNNYNGEAGGYQQSQSINAMPPGAAYGLYTKSDGGPQLPIASITLSGTTATVTLDSANTGLANGDYVDIEGAAQAQYDGSVRHRQRHREFHRRDDDLHLHPSDRLAGLARYARRRAVAHRRAGSTNFTLLQTPSFGTLSGTTYSGAATGIPYVSPLVTDEIMYDPTQPTAAEAAAGYVDNDFEYVELYNRSSSPVTLSDYYVGGGPGYTPGWLPDGSLADNFTVAGITSNGTTATVTIDSTATGFKTGDEIHIDGAAQSLYNGDFTIANVTVNSAAGTTTFTYMLNGSAASPATGTLTAGKDSEFETLESGATATWSSSALASSSYTVYAHLNLYDGDDNPLDLDSQAQYTITVGGVHTILTVDQDPQQATLTVTSLTYNNTSGVVTAIANNGLAVGDIVYVSGATPPQYDGAMVVQSATATSFTYTLASGLNLAAATGTITAGALNSPSAAWPTTTRRAW